MVAAANVAGSVGATFQSWDRKSRVSGSDTASPKDSPIDSSTRPRRPTSMTIAPKYAAFLARRSTTWLTSRPTPMARLCAIPVADRGVLPCGVFSSPIVTEGSTRLFTSEEARP
jgi:hypothetical protein